MSGENDGVPHNAGVLEAQMRTRARQEIERAETASTVATDHVLQAELGNDYESALNLVDAYLDQLPAAQRERIGRQDYDAQGMKALVQRAMGPMPRTPAEAERELDENRKLMADRGSKYWQGPEAERRQLRHRFILRAKEAAKVKA